VYVTDSDPNAVQHATAFTLEMNVPEFSANGIRFLIPPKDNRGWVHYEENVKYPYIFPGDPESAPFDPSGGSDYDTARMAGVIWTTGTSDVSTTGTGLGRVDVFVPKDSPFWGTAHFTPVVSQLAGGVGGVDEVYLVTGQQASFTALPEPASLGALALAAPLLLLRRRAGAAG
jgi:hypothetical protein